MAKLLFGRLARLRRDESGNIAVLFMAAAIPLFVAAGAAVDFSRYGSYRAHLSNAVDAAALALARRHSTYTEAEATTFVTDYVSAFALGDSHFTVQNVAVAKIEDGFHISVQGSMRTMFLPIGNLTVDGQGISTLSGEVVAEVVNASRRIELALVMDNTGSMNCAATLATACVNNWSAPAASSRIMSLKVAAKTLVDTLMRDDLTDKDQVKIAVVPFEGQVNAVSAVADVAAPPSWVDWADQAQSKWNGANFAQNDFGGSIGLKTVGHKWLFNDLVDNFPTVKWAGCVEMRAGSYELTDDAPDTTIPDSLFVPFFSPDEPDSSAATSATTSGITKYNNRSNGASNGTAYTFTNDYLNDVVAYTTSATPAAAQKSLAKYTAAVPAFWANRMDVEGLLTPYEYGPNKGCPRPIYPLANANNKAAIKGQIDSMIAYWSSGTFIPTGLVWGWHVLSPGVPYTEGTKPGDEFYAKTEKAIVLFTDGENDVTDDSNTNRSRYDAYSYVTTSVSGASRLGATAAAATTALDTKTAALCANVKAANIRLYVVTFGTMSASSTTLMQNCATVDDGATLYYHALTTADLQTIFEQIGNDLSDLHLSK